jgi:hypothetical protein
MKKKWMFVLLVLVFTVFSSLALACMDDDLTRVPTAEELDSGNFDDISLFYPSETKGGVNDGGGPWASDNCNEGETKVFEYYCEDGHRKSAYFNCPGSCSYYNEGQGACLPLNFCGNLNIDEVCLNPDRDNNIYAESGNEACESKFGNDCLKMEVYNLNLVWASINCNEPIYESAMGTYRYKATCGDKAVPPPPPEPGENPCYSLASNEVCVNSNNLPVNKGDELCVEASKGNCLRTYLDAPIIDYPLGSCNYNWEGIGFIAVCEKISQPGEPGEEEVDCSDEENCVYEECLEDLYCQDAVCNENTGDVVVWSYNLPNELNAYNQGSKTEAISCCQEDSCAFGNNNCQIYNTLHSFPSWLCSENNNWLVCNSPELTETKSPSEDFYCTGTEWIPVEGNCSDGDDDGGIMGGLVCSYSSCLNDCSAHFDSCQGFNCADEYGTQGSDCYDDSCIASCTDSVSGCTQECENKIKPLPGAANPTCLEICESFGYDNCEANCKLSDDTTCQQFCGGQGTADFDKQECITNYFCEPDDTECIAYCNVGSCNFACQDESCLGGCLDQVCMGNYDQCVDEFESCLNNLAGDKTPTEWNYDCSSDCLGCLEKDDAEFADCLDVTCDERISGPENQTCEFDKELTCDDGFDNDGDEDLLVGVCDGSMEYQGYLCCEYDSDCDWDTELCINNMCLDNPLVPPDDDDHNQFCVELGYHEVKELGDGSVVCIYDEMDELCNDGIDNDFNGKTDSEDNFCPEGGTNPLVNYVPIINGGIDCLDSDCYLENKTGPNKAQCCSTDLDCSPGAICGADNECHETICNDGDNDKDNQSDCLDSDCDAKKCGGTSTWPMVCSKGECKNLATPGLAPTETIITETIFSYNDILAILHEGVVFKEEGICDEICKSKSKTCIFADGGRKTCAEEGSTRCTCR